LKRKRRKRGAEKLAKKTQDEEREKKKQLALRNRSCKSKKKKRESLWTVAKKHLKIEVRNLGREDERGGGKGVMQDPMPLRVFGGQSNRSPLMKQNGDGRGSSLFGRGVSQRTEEGKGPTIRFVPPFFITGGGGAQT